MLIHSLCTRGSTDARCGGSDESRSVGWRASAPRAGLPPPWARIADARADRLDDKAAALVQDDPVDVRPGQFIARQHLGQRFRHLCGREGEDGAAVHPQSPIFPDREFFDVQATRGRVVKHLQSGWFAALHLMLSALARLASP